MGAVYTLTPIFVVLIVSLIVPLFIVVRGARRPVASLLTASCIYMLPMILLIIYSVIGGYQSSTGLELYLVSFGFMVIYLFIGLVVLVPVHRSRRKKLEREMKARAQDVF